MTALSAMMLDDLRQAPPLGLLALLEPIHQRFGDALLGVVLYGSCRRRAQLDDGLVDLLVIVSGYRKAYGTGLDAALNRLLPPNVYYLEVESPQGRLRSKYAVVSLTQFKQRCRHPVDLYFWARFSQPCRLVLVATGEPADQRADQSADQSANQSANQLANQLAAARANAARGFAQRITPLNPAARDAVAFWSFALATSYRCELRPEPPEAARRLVESDADYWERLSTTLAAEGTLPPAFDHTSNATAAVSRRWLRTRAGWMMRRLTGKLYNLARLFKAAGTFSNGIDYVVWKVERHSGVRIEPSERMRRYPRLAAWSLAWRLWRQRGFR